MPLNATSFKPGHKAHPNRYQNGSMDYRTPSVRTEHERLAAKFFRDLKREYGPELTVSQKEHVTNIANIRARLQVYGEKIDHQTFVLLVNAERRELEKLSGD
jgi:hypothetical protein